MLGILIEIEREGVKVVLDTRSKREKNMKAVKQFKMNGEKVAEYPSISSAERITGVHNISECLSNKRRSAGGYLWRLAD